MAKILEGNPTWTATIRCCKAVYGGGRVDGCFTLFEIVAEDLGYVPPGYDDNEGTVTFKCPVCGMVSYPKWQLGNIPSSVFETNKKK